MKKIYVLHLVSLFLWLCIISSCELSTIDISTDTLTAYPVPYNPYSANSVLTVAFPDAPAAKIYVSIMDSNGDCIHNKNAETFPVLWNGRNAAGDIVNPGLYIVKIRVESLTDNAYGKKIIRVPVEY